MIGALKHALRLQKPHHAADGGGGRHSIWQDVENHAQIYAAITAAGGGDSLRQHKRSPQVSHYIRIRYRSDVEAGMRFLTAGGDAAYEIISLRDTAGDAKWLDITAVKKPV